MDKHYVCDKHKTKGNTGKCPFCHPDHIADANKKAQPAPALPGDDGEICARLLSACTGHPHALIPWPHRLLHDAVSHISDLTRRLAEAEAENGRFAGMLESSVSDWRKLYTKERAERVRIEGILLNDVQDERQESDEHIKGLVTVIKTQDKNIGDLKAHIQRIGVDHDDVEARAESAEARVRELEFYRADALKEMRQQLELLSAYHVESVTARIGSVLARVRELEAFKARVMAWARGRCGACGHEGSEGDTCYDCNSDDERSNWTPPQAWEVGE